MANLVEKRYNSTVGLNLKNPQVEALAAEVARLAQETKTEAIRRALAERLARLKVQNVKGTRKRSLTRYLEQNVWPLMPAAELGRTLSREEEDQILGYGPDGF